MNYRQLINASPVLRKIVFFGALPLVVMVAMGRAFRVASSAFIDEFVAEQQDLTQRVKNVYRVVVLRLPN